MIGRFNKKNFVRVVALLLCLAFAAATLCSNAWETAFAAASEDAKNVVIARSDTAQAATKQSIEMPALPGAGLPDAASPAAVSPEAPSGEIATPPGMGLPDVVSPPAAVSPEAPSPPAALPAAVPEGYPSSYGAFTSSYAWFTPDYCAFSSGYAATMYLPGTKTMRAQRIRPYLDRAKPMIALTFDDGPAQYTERIVALLGEYDCRATFCVLGNRVKPQKARVRAIAAQGSEVVGHSWDHKDLTLLTKEEIVSELKKTNNAIQAVTGVRPTMYRPPYGAADDVVRKISKKQKLALLTWSFDTHDWELLNAEKLFKRIKKEVKPDQILLMHDIHEKTADSMELVIPWLVDQGYELVTVSELLYYKGIKIKPGETYNDGK
jgi:peptidoglycan/xylan/chitin deacetylase (PgdA/CDA1 family)